MCQTMRRLSKLQFGGGAFVGALIIGALVAHATGCNILSRHDLYIPVFVVCFICFFVVYFRLFCLFTHRGTTYLFTMLPRGPIRTFNFRRRSINNHVANKCVGRTPHRAAPCAILLPEENGRIHHESVPTAQVFPQDEKGAQH